MIITAHHTFSGFLDLSAMERLQETGNPVEKLPFHLTVRPGDVVEVDDIYCGLINIQNSISAGFIDIVMSYDYCDDKKVKAIPGYNPNKKQVLVNINGIIGWQDAKDCNGADA